MSEGIDYGAFSNNGIDSVSDNSWIIRQFNAKNRRVNAIFREDDDDQDVFGQRQSHGLRLESITAGSTTSDKENNEKSSQRSSGHMRALSPKSVHEADPAEINDVRPRITANLRRSDLRRSLFKQNEQRLFPLSVQEITCSTPMPTKRSTTTKSTFIDESVNISPIKHFDRNDLLRNEDGVQAIEVQQSTHKTPVKIVEVTSLKCIEKDLREQYQIDAEKTPRSNRKEKSFISEPGRTPTKSSAKKSLPQRGLSAPPMSMTKVKQCSILIEPVAMEMSEDLIKTYQQSRLQRLSVSQCNKTDMRSVQVAETPVAKSNNAHPVVDEELAKRLRLCESNNEMTSDEDEQIDEQEAIVPQVQSNMNNAKTPTKNSTLKRLQSTIRNDDMSVASQNSSINKKVSENVLESLRELRRTITNETANSISGVPTNQSVASQSCRLNMTKKRKQTRASGQIEEYMRLSNKRKKSKSINNKKRTLYSHHSDEEDSENMSPKSSIASSIQRKESAEVIYRNDNEMAESNTDSGSSQTEFRKPYKQGPLKTKKKYGIISQREVIRDGSRETPKSSRPSAHRSEKSTRNHVEEVNFTESEPEQQQQEVSSEEEEVIEETVPKKKTRAERLRSEKKESQVQSIKKSRGRPSKHTKTVRQRVDDEELQYAVNERSRSHPRKDASPALPTDDDDKQLPDVTKKSRGRPRKNASPVQHRVDDEELQYAVNERSRSHPRKDTSPALPTDDDDKQLPDVTKNSRGRPRKIASPVQQRVDDEEFVNEEEEQEKQPAPKPKKQKEKQSKPKHPQRDVSHKRNKPDEGSSDEEIPLRRRRRVSENSDEGFNESNDSDFDVIRVPDNDRYALRKRRMCKPWWIPTAPSNMRIKYEYFTSNDVKAEKKIKELQKTTGINPSKAYHGSNAFMPPPNQILKVMKELAKDKRKHQKVDNFFKKSQAKTQQAATVNDDHESVESIAISVQTDASIQTTQTIKTPSEAIYHAFKDLSEISGVGRRVEMTDAFDVAQFDSIDWVECPNGLFFYGFLGQHGDGLIKVLPGGSKGKSRTKKSTLKFVILCGEVTFIINNNRRTIKNFGYVNIHEDQRYEIRNESDKEVILSFTRLVPPSLTPKQVQ